MLAHRCIRCHILPTFIRHTLLRGCCAIVGAAVNYLAMRQRKIRIFSGVEIRTEEGWREMTRAIELMTAAFAVPAGQT